MVFMLTLPCTGKVEPNTVQTPVPRTTASPCCAGGKKDLTESRYWAGPNLLTPWTVAEPAATENFTLLAVTVEKATTETSAVVMPLGPKVVNWIV